MPCHSTVHATSEFTILKILTPHLLICSSYSRSEANFCNLKARATTWETTIALATSAVLYRCLFHSGSHQASGVAMDCAACAKHKGPRAWGAHALWLN